MREDAGHVLKTKRNDLDLEMSRFSTAHAAFFFILTPISSPILRNLLLAEKLSPLSPPVTHILLMLLNDIKRTDEPYEVSDRSFNKLCQQTPYV